MSIHGPENSHPPEAKKPISPRQLAANRANFQKSTGPKTQAGKDRSRFNNLKHGLTANQVCIPGESREEYDLRLQAYVDFYQPAHLVDMDVVEDLVACVWRKRRAVKFEAAIVLEAYSTRHAEVEKNYEDITPDVEAALAFRSQCDESAALKLLDRYEPRMGKDAHRNRKYLDERPRNPPSVAENPSSDQISRNEAIPEIEHPPTVVPEPVTSEPVMTVVPRIPHPDGTPTPASIVHTRVNGLRYQTARAVT